MNIITLLRQGEAKLRASGIEDPRLDADLLLGRVLGITRDRLYLEREWQVSAPDQEDYLALLTRRARREPLQYILGEQEFMGLSFYVDERVLIPRADTEILAEAFLRRVAEREGSGLRVLDLCTGSGALAITVAHFRPNLQVTGTDLSQDALEVARLNGERLGVRVDWRQGDFLTPVRGEIWDWILTNPPYVSLAEYQECAPELAFEPKQALLGGDDGLKFYRRLAAEAPAFLQAGGQILMEIGWLQGESVSAIFRRAGFETEILLDLAGRDRVLLAR